MNLAAHSAACTLFWDCAWRTKRTCVRYTGEVEAHCGLCLTYLLSRCDHHHHQGLQRTLIDKAVVTMLAIDKRVTLLIIARAWAKLLVLLA
jgi:hypothetical protein